MQEQSIKKRDIKKLLIKIGLLLLFFVGVEFIAYSVKVELKQQRILAQFNRDALIKKEDLQGQIEECEMQKKEALEEFVNLSSAKSCVILCLDNNYKSAYKDAVKLMDSYGFTGVLVFRDGKVPGMKNCISVEEYQSLLDKGWEGAIGNKNDIRIYHNIPAQAKAKWSEYIDEMRSKFVKNGLPCPSVYIPHSREDIAEVETELLEYGMTAYTSLEDDISAAATDMQLDAFYGIGMLRGKYYYTEWIDDITKMMPYAYSVALWIEKVEYAEPKDLNYLSIGLLRRRLSELEEMKAQINITTFTGYYNYQKEIINQYEDEFYYYRSIINKQNDIIKELRQEIAGIYNQ